ncbi:ATP synthase F1 subunit delta [Carboxylicivirga mesophila]|uniref:ATP synthase subunit delta n=1 Tax=Carboxylicivirga mesophila TaxID=1166478 RepID=A0ABS5KDE1_9BACT|nr:ATP synthase F1 subunit delta [Carboxylicivirga mesophila]MBS2213059.1 ATP synthase F1 subunit delta [Carboxylicivirga mesophila]
MNRSLIADRYAKALFKLAMEQKELEQIYQDVNMLQSYCNDAEGFTDLLNSPVVKPGQKKQAFHSVLEGKVNRSTLNLLDLLITNNREVLLADINRRFIWLYKNEKGIKEVTVYTAIDFDDQQHDVLNQFLKEQFKAPIELTIKVKPELLGGFILKVDGKMADASMSTKLKQIKKQLLS